MTFSQRKTIADSTQGQVLPDLMSKRDYNYTPQINKLKGYSQMPNPVVRIDSIKKLARSVSIYFTPELATFLNFHLIITLNYLYCEYKTISLC